MVDATLISAPGSTKNRSRTRDPEMHQTKKGNNWYFGMKAHIGADVNDATVGNDLLHGQEEDVFADAGCQGANKRPEAEGGNAQWRWR